MPSLQGGEMTFQCLLGASLDLLSTPTLIRLAHVRRRLDGGNELEDEVANTDETDDGAGNVTQHPVVQQDGADEDVD